MKALDARERIVELCGVFYGLGWVSGTGGGISIREGDRIYVAPSGVQKERIDPADIFELSLDGDVVATPANTALKLSACAPLFLHAYRKRDAGAVIHSHSIHAMMATLAYEKEFQITHVEMIKGIRESGYHDILRVPIIENTAHECDLADTMGEAIDANPHADAILVRRHGVYVWGRDWIEAKTQAESYDYLFQSAVEMKKMGLDPTAIPR